MRSQAVVAPRDRAESVRRRLQALGVLRSGLKVQRDGGAVAFPVEASLLVAPEGTHLEDREFEEMELPPAGGYAERLGLPAELRSLAPRSFDVVGDIVLLRVPDDLHEHATVLGEALLKFVPGARIVAADEGVKGPERVRQLVRLAGEGDFRTVHRENGLSFEVDLAAAYFSPRLAREHARVASAVVAGERVLDLCCGVGPFGLTAARLGTPSSVTLVDANPAAAQLARSNARRLGVEAKVRVVEARIEELLTGEEVAPRVIFNLPHEGIKYVSQVAAAVERRGTLHHFEVMERSSRSTRLPELAASLPQGDWSVVESHVVHPYSPSADLMAVTLHRGGA
jgi:tRNA (guanine37-N1)-methyltransferase